MKINANWVGFYKIIFFIKLHEYKFNIYLQKRIIGFNIGELNKISEKFCLFENEFRKSALFNARQYSK